MRMIRTCGTAGCGVSGVKVNLKLRMWDEPGSYGDYASQSSDSDEDHDPFNYNLQSG